MLIKPGVDIRRLRKPIRRTLGEVDLIVKTATGEEAVITSTYEGNHSPSSLHYADLAYDVRVSAGESIGLRDRIKAVLGESYDIVWEVDHIHIEYDPKG